MKLAYLCLIFLTLNFASSQEKPILLVDDFYLKCENFELDKELENIIKTRLTEKLSRLFTITFDRSIKKEHLKLVIGLVKTPSYEEIKYRIPKFGEKIAFVSEVELSFNLYEPKDRISKFCGNAIGSHADERANRKNSLEKSTEATVDIIEKKIVWYLNKIPKPEYESYDSDAIRTDAIFRMLKNVKRESIEIVNAEDTEDTTNIKIILKSDFALFLGEDPKNIKNDEPVSHISYNKALEYIKWYKNRSKKIIIMPSKEEVINNISKLKNRAVFIMPSNGEYSYSIHKEVITLKTEYDLEHTELWGCFEFWIIKK